MTKTLRDTYVVHGMKKGFHVNEDVRREFGNRFPEAFAYWKQLMSLGYRVGMFYWDYNGRCVRNYASDTYNLERDFPQ